MSKQWILVALILAEAVCAMQKEKNIVLSVKSENILWKMFYCREQKLTVDNTCSFALMKTRGLEHFEKVKGISNII